MFLLLFCLVFSSFFVFVVFLEFFWFSRGFFGFHKFVFVGFPRVFLVLLFSSSFVGFCCGAWFIQLHFSREQRRRFLMS